MVLRGGGGNSLLYNSLNYPLWLVADDIFYYNKSDELCQKYKISKSNLIILPTYENIVEFLKSYNGFVVLSTQYPPIEFRNIFVIEELPPKFGILTTQQHYSGVPENVALEQRLGLSVIESPFKLKDVGGAYKLKQYARDLIEAEKLGFRAKGIFLVGIPGTGKTFFPKCFAGELNRLLVQLNISLIMEDPEPINKLNSIFKFLDKRQKTFPDSKYIILIDEIEKMIGNATPEEKRMLGRLLTVLNDMHTPASEYSFDALFFATANDLNTILDNNPEFLRRGRWNELFFINMPTDEFAKDIFEIYIKKKNLGLLFEGSLTLDDLLTDITQEYQKDNPALNRFPYTAAEIENFCERLYFLKLARGKDFDIAKDIKQCIKDIIPIGKSARKSIERMLGQEELFIEV